MTRTIDSYPGKPHHEPEVTDAMLKDWGCPFAMTDPRMIDWLDGYKAGLRGGAAIAVEAYDQTMREAGK